MCGFLWGERKSDIKASLWHPSVRLIIISYKEPFSISWKRYICLMKIGIRFELFITVIKKNPRGSLQLLLWSSTSMISLSRCVGVLWMAVWMERSSTDKASLTKMKMMLSWGKSEECVMFLQLKGTNQKCSEHNYQSIISIIKLVFNKNGCNLKKTLRKEILPIGRFDNYV